MYELKILKQFSKVPVFSLSDVNQVIGNRDYAKKFLKRMVEKKNVYKIKRDKYTLYDDSFLVSSFLIKPSYISSVSALSYHKLITQIPNEVFCIITRKSSKIKFFIDINFLHTDYFFGFRNENYGDFKVLVADPEKAIIDSFGVVPVSVFEEAFESIDVKRMIKYLKRIKKSSIVKRVGYLMEKNGFDVYEKLKEFVNYKYIPLDPLIKKGEKNKKWKLLV